MKQTSAYRLLLLISLLLNVGLIVTVIFVALRKRDGGGFSDMDVCPTTHPEIPAATASGGAGDWDSDPDTRATARKTGTTKEAQKLPENVFQDLSKEEIVAVLEYMYNVQDLGLVKPQEANATLVTANSIYSVELYVPHKAEVLAYLAGQRARPLRQAKVVTLEPQSSPPRVMEYVVTPLPNPKTHFPDPRRRKQVPYRVRQPSSLEMAELVLLMRGFMEPRVEKLLKELFGASFIDCGQRCLTITATPVSTAVAPDRSMWIQVLYQVEFPTLYPVGLQFLISSRGSDEKSWQLEKLMFANLTFASFDELLEYHRKGLLPKVSVHYPQSSSGASHLAGMLSLRGQPVPQEPVPKPRQYQPNQNRFTVHSQRVTYLRWQFSWRMSIARGIQLFDIRYGNERVAYELSLQEVAVLYSGANPVVSLSQILDSSLGLGTNAHGLMPDVDCPEYATFQDTVLYTEVFGEPQIHPKAVCLFEHNTQTPLRRHKANSFSTGFFYGGLVDTVLVLRTCYSLFNYDYLLDFVFHSNGVLETIVRASGYIIGSVHSLGEKPFGFQVHENLLGNLHHHLFHFKVDVDIVDAENRYQTLDLRLDNRTWPWTAPGQPFHQTVMHRYLRRTEKAAAFSHNASTTLMYHVIYNEKLKNAQGNPRGFRILNRAPSVLVNPDYVGQDRSMRWARWQVAVTRRKEEEESSSSMHAQFDANDPVVDFQSFISDNEDIVDKDLVAWITVGMHHIPHAEDIPNTSTPGKDLAFALIPFNFFNEDPSMASRDAVRVDADVDNKTLKMEIHGLPTSYQCIPPYYNYTAFLSSADSLFFGISSPSS